MNSLLYNPAYVAEPAVVAQSGGAQDMLTFAGEVIVNGVNVPLHVIEQLRQAGISAVSWLTQGELQDAVQATKYDGRLIDDDKGMSFRDKLTLTAEEQQARRPKKRKPQSFEEILKEEREGKQAECEDEISLLGLG